VLRKRGILINSTAEHDLQKGAMVTLQKDFVTQILAIACNGSLIILAFGERENNKKC